MNTEKLRTQSGIYNYGHECFFQKPAGRNEVDKFETWFHIFDFGFSERIFERTVKEIFLRIQCECNFFEKVRAKISQDNPELSHYSMFRIKIVLASMKGQRNTRGQIVIMNEMVHV